MKVLVGVKIQRFGLSRFRDCKVVIDGLNLFPVDVGDDLVES